MTPAPSDDRRQKEVTWGMQYLRPISENEREIDVGRRNLLPVFASAERMISLG